jgi:toxin ParE1/3/4
MTWTTSGATSPTKAAVLSCQRLVDSIANRFFLLSGHPYLGRVRDNDFGAGSRSFPVGEYIIVYCVEDGDVFILRVAQGRRDIEELFGH